jgi:L-aminopeptidase/D-esterase-like protein
MSASPGDPTLALDFPSLWIGVAEYPDGPTGCTLFYFPGRAMCAVDVRGGSPGVLLLDQWGSGDARVDAVCLCGGSAYGLEAASGVAGELLERRGRSTHWDDIARVAGAVIYDFLPRRNAIHPDKSLGRAALRSAAPGEFPLGRRGAGCSATVGKLFGPDRMESAGQGGAFREIGPTKVAVFTVVNAVGAIVDRDGRVARGHVGPAGIREHAVDVIPFGDRRGEDAPPGNTTLSVLVTNQRLGSFFLRQLARQVHASMARAIQPFHTWRDGDVCFALSTQEVEDPGLGVVELGVVAGELAWDAILGCFERP